MTKITTLSMTALLSVLSLSASRPALADDTLADDLLGNLYAMRGVYRAKYAPAAWKLRISGYDLNTEFTKASDAVSRNPKLTIADSRPILKNFIYAMKDYHTSISFTATEAASLPFTVRGAGDRLFIVDIDRNKLPEATFPFHVGDELITFGNKTAAQAVADVQAETPANVPSTDRAIAEINLTRRRAARGLNVPSGPITIGILAKGETRVRRTQLLWDYVPESIFPRGSLAGGFQVASILDATQSSSLLRPRMDVDLVDASPMASPFDVGARRTFTPALGTKSWESADDSTFHAYIFVGEGGKKVGYLRLPSYGTGDYTKAVADFAANIARFETETDALVIDQVNNPGGSVFYLYALASMLSDQPLTTPRHRMAVTQADVIEALDTIRQLKDVKNDEDARKVLSPDDMNGYPTSYEFARFTLAYAQFLVDEWNAGRKLTRPYWIAGVDHINPAPVHYTKPILLLTNALDFSGGDFFPAILQDNKRVTIMGTRTAGAGGYVGDVKIPNNVGIESFRVTMSIAERADGNPIENLGITPDINYELSADDFQNNFAPYVSAIRAAVAGLH